MAISISRSIISSSSLTHPVHRSQALFFKFNPRSNFSISKQKNGLCFLGSQINGDSKKKGFVVFSGQPGDPLPSGVPSGSWKNWIIGALIAVILPLMSHKFGPLLTLKKEVEAAVEIAKEVAEEVEKVAEGAEKVAGEVEKVAEEVEKVAEDIAGDLPEGGKLRKVVTMVENLAKEADKDARKAEKLVDQVEKVDEKVESMVESVIDETEGEKGHK